MSIAKVQENGGEGALKAKTNFTVLRRRRRKIRLQVSHPPFLLDTNTLRNCAAMDLVDIDKLIDELEGSGASVVANNNHVQKGESVQRVLFSSLF